MRYPANPTIHRIGRTKRRTPRSRRGSARCRTSLERVRDADPRRRGPRAGGGDLRACSSSRRSACWLRRSSGRARTRATSGSEHPQCAIRRRALRAWRRPRCGAARRPIFVTTEIVSPSSLAETVSSTGTLLAAESVELQAEVNGKITAIDFVEGARVRRGRAARQAQRRRPAGAAARGGRTSSRSRSAASAASPSCSRKASLFPTITTKR